MPKYGNNLIDVDDGVVGVNKDKVLIGENDVCIPDRTFEHTEAVNDVARFTQINRSNGNAAASAFTATNDSDYRASFGVWSSNNNLTGGPGPNGGGIGFVSPGTLTFTHYYYKDTTWRNNPTDDGTLANTVETMKLDKDGHLTVKGNMYGGILGEVKMFALSITNAVTKATLQSNGWAICDGTTPATQGISSPNA